MEQGLITDSLAEPSLGELLRGLDEPGLVSNLVALESRAGEIRERALKRVVDARLRDRLSRHNNRYLNLATRKYIEIGSYATEQVRRDLAEAASLLGMLVVREQSIKIDDESEYFCPVTISEEDLEWLGKSAAAAHTSEPMVWFHLECLRGTYQTLNYDPKDTSAVGEFFKSVYQVYKAGKGLAEIDFDPLIELWGGVREERGRFPDSWVCPAMVILWAGFDEAEYTSLPRSFDRFIARRKKPVGIGFAYAYTFLRKARAGIGRESCLSRLRQLERVDHSTWAGLRTHIRAGLEVIEAPSAAAVAIEPVHPVLVEPTETVTASEVTTDDEVLDEAYGRFCREVEWVEYSADVDYEKALTLFTKKQFEYASFAAQMWRGLPGEFEKATAGQRLGLAVTTPVRALWSGIMAMVEVEYSVRHALAMKSEVRCVCRSCKGFRKKLIWQMSEPIKDLFRKTFPGEMSYLNLTPRTRDERTSSERWSDALEYVGHINSMIDANYD